MRHIDIQGQRIKILSKNTVIVGAGAAALNAADRLFSYGVSDIAIVCEDLMQSTSRNTGSDKQTYYKLSLAGEEVDSVAALAETLMNGQCVDGDIALSEAANSAQCFLRLCELGVPFPVNRYGEYIGYKTDHDPRRRATSAGPLTSRLMVESLERAVRQKNIPIYSGKQVILILSAGGRVYGLLCLNLNGTDSPDTRFTAFNCENIIYATGGPAGMYADSVYPVGQCGATGIAFEAGVRGKNLTEWQYGLASLVPRWNVSGTYMQAIPRFISTDSRGGDEREFLNEYFLDAGEMHTKVFLKGYEWPFDARRASSGSSLIDMLVYNERCIRNRRVFLDFTRNPHGLDFSQIEIEAREYLERAGALFGKPIDRLIHMNEPAYAFYRDRGADLQETPLEIAVCAQHNNGGLSVDCWWRTNIEGFFAVGEASATHGVYRPGGSALNAGQVGSMRAAQYIAQNRSQPVRDIDSFTAAAGEKIAGVIGMHTMSDESNIDALTERARRSMSKAGAVIRQPQQISQLAGETKELLSDFEKRVKINDSRKLGMLYRFYDMLLSQYVYLSAMRNYMENGGKSRGSALYYDVTGEKPHPLLGEVFRFAPDDGAKRDMVQEVLYSNGNCSFTWRKVREIPKEDDFFENVWKRYRENRNIY